jgi:hypothetical protein
MILKTKIMKKISILLIAIVFTMTSYSQSIQEEIEILQSVYGLDKKEITANFLELSSEQEADFWELYNQYESKRKAIGKEKFEILSQYVSDYGEISAEDADVVMKKSIPLRKESYKLIDTYYKKIKKKTDPVVAMQFYQLESYLLNMVRMAMLENVFSTKE